MADVTKKLTLTEGQWGKLEQLAVRAAIYDDDFGLPNTIQAAEVIAVTEHTNVCKDKWAADAVELGVTPDVPPCPCGSEGFCLGHRDDCPY